MRLSNKLSTFVLTLVLAVGFSTVSAQEQNPLQQEVEAATKNLIEAMLKPKAETLKALASEQLTYGHSSGKIETKAQFVETLVSGASVFNDIQISKQTVHIQDQTAIVRHVFAADTNDPGKGPAKIRLGIALTWVKSNGTWQLLARQAYSL